MQQRTFVRVVLALATLWLGGGCEVAIPLIVAAETPGEEPPTEVFPGSIPIELIDVAGHVITEDVGGLSVTAPTGLDAMSGFLFLQVEGSAMHTTSLQISTCDLSGQDPYGGLEQPLPSEIPGEDPSAFSRCGDTSLLVAACSDDGTCANPEEVSMERVATPEGVELRIDAAWDETHALFLRFREVR